MNNKLTALFDMSQTISSEVSLIPLLTKVLERLMFHTESSCGLVLKSAQLADHNFKYQIKVALGEQNIERHVDNYIEYPNKLVSSEILPETDFDLSLLPIKQDYYHSHLTFLVEGYGVILLLSENIDNSDEHFDQLFTPLASNLSNAVLLCRNNDAISARSKNENEDEINILEKIAIGLSVKSGKDFFQSVALNLSELLNSECALICQISPENPKYMDSVAISVNGEITNNLSYELSGTPCEHVINSEKNTITVFSSELQQLFPLDKFIAVNNVQSYIGTPLLNEREEIIGLISIMNKLPTEKTKRIEDILSIFSSRVSNEIERLQRLDEMLQVSSVVENSPVLVFRWRAIEGWPVEFVSNNVRQLGYSPEDFISGKKSYSSIVHPEDLLRVETEVREFASSEVNEFTQEYRIVAVDGKVLWTFDRTSIERDEEGNITYYQGTVIDISDRKHMEEELRRSEQHLKLYREQTPLAAIEWNLDFQVVNWNRAAEKMFGYTFEEAKILNFVEVMLPDYTVADIMRIRDNSIENMGGTNSINENITKDGRIILCKWLNSTLVNEDGDVIGVASLIMDITEEHQAQLDLLDKEQEQHDILDSMLDGVISIDETGCIISFNKMAEKLFGYKYEEIIGQNVNLLMPEYHSSHHDGYIQNYLDTGVAHVIGLAKEVEGQHKDKTTFPLRLSIAELPLEKNGKRRFIGSCQDLSIVKEQEELLRRSQKMDALGKLTGGIAHDYNNMLGVVLGYSELLESMLSDQPKLAKYANQIQKAGQRGAKLTKRLLSFSRHNAPTQSNEVDINVLLAEQQDMIQKTLTARVKLELHLADDLWAINLDQSEFEDAILNMSINAMHAMAEGGSLIIVTKNHNLHGIDALMLDLPPGDYIQLCISDTGSGMDSVTKSKLFDPFYSTKGNRGTGLGLSQVFGFVKRADGVINVHSRLGQGSKFIIYFPRHNVEKNVSSDEFVDKTIDYPGQESILIVDDEVFLLDLLTEILTAQGYQIIHAENAKEALSILENEAINLMLSDVIMPGMDGYQLSAIVQEKYPEIKIQLATGYNDERQKGNFDKSLYQNILFKPYDKTVLLKRIRDLLDGNISTAQTDTLSKVLTSSIDWSDKLSVNILEIDDDHKVLLSLLNRCVSLVNNVHNEKNEQGIILQDLLTYTQYHFKREERIMKICEYPDTKIHRQAHKQLIEEVHQRKKKFEQDDECLESLLKFISDWLIQHIMGIDKELASFCKGKEKLISEALLK